MMEYRKQLLDGLYGELALAAWMALHRSDRDGGVSPLSFRGSRYSGRR